MSNIKPSSSNPPPTRPIVAAPQGTVINREPFLPEALLAYLNAPFVDHREMDDFPVIKINIVNKTDWVDTEYKVTQHLRLPEKDKRELAIMGDEFLTEIHSTVTIMTLQKLFVLAYNILDRTGARIMPTPDGRLYDESKIINGDEMGDQSLKSVRSHKYRITCPSTDYELLATGYTYLAASYFHLFTRPAHNYTLIEKHLKDRFKTLYGRELPFEGYHPREEVVKIIRCQFDLEPVFKDTFYIYLHCGLRSNRGEKIRKFLFDLHVNTGLHSLTLFEDVIAEYRANAEVLTETLFSNKISDELHCIKKVYKTFGNADTNKEKQMWKYARIFDQTFLSALQTKKCKFFTLVLAYMLRVTRKDKYKGVLEITQIKDVGELVKREALAYAMRAQEIIGQKNYFSDTNHSSDI